MKESKILRREPVDPEKRKAMTPARMERIWHAWEGRCCVCGEPVDMRGEGVRYDHRLALHHGGKELDEKVGPSHYPRCDKPKTARDAKISAKIRRQQKMMEPKEPGSIKSAGFRKDGPKQKIPSRPFPSRKRP